MRDPELSPFRILLVEDSADHTELIRRGLARSKCKLDLRHVVDGEDALLYLQAEGRTDHPWPDLVLLDLRLPKIDGLAVLRALKGDPRTLTIPVLVLTSSAADRDLVAAYEGHANAYLVKPTTFQGFCELMSDVTVFWAEHNTRPPRLKADG